MTDTRRTVKGPGSESNSPDSRPKKVNLHRYQIMTIPMELQKELASLPMPQLTDEEMKPLPPIDPSTTGEQNKISPLAVSISRTLQFIAAQRIAIVVGAVLAVGVWWFLGRTAGEHPSPLPSPSESNALSPPVEAPTSRLLPVASAAAVLQPNLELPLAPKGPSITPPKKTPRRPETSPVLTAATSPEAESPSKRAPRKSVFKPE